MTAGFRALLIAIAACMPAGCASTPQASAERDAEAKQFISQPADATLYVYRTDTSFDIEDDAVLWMDGRLVGATLPLAYFRIHAAPGAHALNGMGPDNGRLRLEARPGEIYFIRLQVSAGQSVFEPMDPVRGRRELSACCVLLENWRPGQRPLLR